MARYRLSNKAEEDLSNIWNYTWETWSETQADKYYAMLLDCCRVLAEQPNIGKKYDAVYVNLFGHSVGQHIIFYQVTSDREIEVIRILHSRMDLEKRIRD